jgi:MFS family permease
MPKLAFFGLLTANIISLVGSALTLIALPWFVLQTTGSAFQMGLTGFVETLAVILAGFFGGALVDRTGYKLVSIVADLTSGRCIFVIPLLHNNVGLAFWQLLGLVFLAALFNTPGNTARHALLPQLTERVGFRLEQANAAYQGGGTGFFSAWYASGRVAYRVAWPAQRSMAGCRYFSDFSLIG